MQRLATAVLFVLPFLYSTEQVVGLTKANAPCKSACGCKSRLLRRLNLYTNKYADGINNERKNTEAYAKLVAAALAAEPLMRKTILPLLWAAADILDTCWTELAAARPLVQAAVSKVEEAAGVYNTLHKIEQGLGEARIEFGGSNLNLPVDKFTGKSLEAITDSKCPKEGADEAGIQIDFEHEENEPEPAKLITHSHLDVTCKSSMGQTGSCHTNPVDAHTHLTIGLSFSDTIKDEASTWASATRTKATIHSHTADFIANNATAAHEALKEIRTKKRATPCSSLITDFDNIKKAPTFKLMVIKPLLNKPTAEKESDATNTAVDEAINTAYGKQGSDYNTKTWKDIGSTRIPKADPSGEKTDTIDKLSSLTQWGDAIARLLLQQTTKQEERSIKTAINKTVNKECDKHTAKTEAECKKTWM
uniref:Variant surface glycoprotein n=1 Tax=Trypanosoma brucei TaxID=5691 RepID=A0A1V0FZA5_9TRYP|nr:variant surface glycoprotein [Trypanosoma brucei]